MDRQRAVFDIFPVNTVPVFILSPGGPRQHAGALHFQRMRQYSGNNGFFKELFPGKTVRKFRDCRKTLLFGTVPYI